ncbi:MAG: hypothetical protein PHT82_00390 [Candidatus Portnoybacteria bacterium]|nr:hypothetical protein [Candidatus Portnoybacteria bacterium]
MVSDKKESILKKTIIGFVVVLLMVAFTFGQDQYKKVSRFGVAPLKMGGVHGEQDLMDLFNQEQKALSVIFNKNDALVKVFLEQMFGVAIWYQKFVRGEKFLSMTYRWNGSVMDTGKWEWDDDKPFMAYAVSIEFLEKRYWIVVPEICGNICLWKIEEIEAIETPQLPQIKEYPSRSLNGKLPEPKSQLQPSPEIQFESQKSIIPKPAQMDFFAGVGIGGFYSCFMEYGIVELGIKRQIFDSTDLLGSIGIGVPIGRDRDNWYTVPMVNLDLVGMLFEPIYIGFGIGFSGKMKEGQESQLEYGPDMGFRIKNCDLFVRGRVPFKGDLRGLGGNYKISLQIQFYF